MAVDEHIAGSALVQAATHMAACQSQFMPQDMNERRIGRRLDCAGFGIDREFCLFGHDRLQERALLLRHK